MAVLQVLFQYQNFPVTGAEAEGVQIEEFDFEWGLSIVDLSQPGEVTAEGTHRTTEPSAAVAVTTLQSSTGAVRQSSNTFSTSSLPSACDATAPCDPVQNGHWFSLLVNAANNSRSPTVQRDGPRMTGCISSENAFPKISGR